MRQIVNIVTVMRDLLQYCPQDMGSGQGMTNQGMAGGVPKSWQVRKGNVNLTDMRPENVGSLLESCLRAGVSFMCTTTGKDKS